MKICAKCNQTLDFDLFHKNSRSKDGHCSYCKTCAKQSVSDWKKTNPLKRARNQRLYNSRNREKIAIKAKERIARNPENFAAKRKLYAKRNRLKGYGLTPETLAEKLNAQGGCMRSVLEENHS
jgi:hypothetical protein